MVLMVVCLLAGGLVGVLVFILAVCIYIAPVFVLVCVPSGLGGARQGVCAPAPAWCDVHAKGAGGAHAREGLAGGSDRK